MAKRFTDTEKWDRQWFLSIPGEYRAFWMYLCDRCAYAGVWNKNMPLAKVYVGFDLDEEAALRHFGDRVIPIAADKWFISKFIIFQYGKFRQNKSVHQAVLSKLVANGLRWPSEQPAKALARPSHKDKDKELDMAQDKDKAKAKAKAVVGGRQ